MPPIKNFNQHSSSVTIHIHTYVCIIIYLFNYPHLYLSIGAPADSLAGPICFTICPNNIIHRPEQQTTNELVHA